MTASSPTPAELAIRIAERVSAREHLRRPGESICLEIQAADARARVGIFPEGLARALATDEEFGAAITLRASASTAAEILAGSLDIPEAITKGLIKVEGQVSKLATIGDVLRGENA